LSPASGEKINQSANSVTIPATYMALVYGHDTDASGWFVRRIPSYETLI
jgi:hypothetical protein